jgi:DNA repair photolyase
MPDEVARVTDLRTSRISERIAAIDDFVEAGYEVHLNFSPVVVQEGWLEGWARLFDEIDAGIGEAAKRQLACEVILLTHNAELHEVNLGWHPRGEELIWRPDLQETKRSQSGQTNVRYRTGWKGHWVRQLTDLMAERLPYCRVRYAF